MRRPMPPAEHFAAPPNWEWWILAYFFFGGISGGSYAIGTLLRLVGTPADQRAARIAFITSFVALLPCPLFLIADLGQPLRFVNMLLDASGGGLSFKPWSALSLTADGTRPIRSRASCAARSVRCGMSLAPVSGSLSAATPACCSPCRIS